MEEGTSADGAQAIEDAALCAFKANCTWTTFGFAHFVSRAICSFLFFSLV